MREFVTTQEMSKVDLATMRALSISSFELMDRVADEMFLIFKGRSALSGRTTVLCGPGNNGGDGYRLAEKLRCYGREVSCLEVFPPESKDCVRARKEFKGECVSKIPKDSEIIVDAIFGSGGRADLSKAISQILKMANQAKAIRVSLDVPTGVDTLSGMVHKSAFLSDLTLVVAYPKTVFILEEVAETLGEICFVGGFFSKPRGVHIFAIEDTDFVVPNKKRTGHKGNYGKCGVVGGSSGMPGAALLAAEAAHRVGAGYVTLFFAKNEGLKLKIADASFLFKTKWKMSDLLRLNSVVIGCGGVPKNFRYDRLACPVIVDAEALGDWKKMKEGRFLLTPHPGEAALILGSSTEKVGANRLGALEAMVANVGQSVYLKGAPGLLKFSDSHQESYVNLYTNSIFSKAGSGDILSGILGGFLCQLPFNRVTEQRKTEEFQLFRDAVVSSLVFQRNLGEVLRSKPATIASDQLGVFSEALKRLGVR